MSVKTYYLDTDSLLELEEYIDRIIEILNSKQFYQYIGNKCLDLLKEISLNKLTTINEENLETSKYINSHHLEIKDNVIILSNDSMVDLSKKNMTDETMARYTIGLSLAKIVEYGIGYTGWINPNIETGDWQYDVNNHGYKGWYYKDDNGNTVWTNGFAGRQIYANLMIQIGEKLDGWVEEYFNTYYKD